MAIYEERQDKGRLFPSGKPVFRRKSNRYRQWEENQNISPDQPVQTVVAADRRLINQTMVKDFKVAIRSEIRFEIFRIVEYFLTRMFIKN